MAQENKFLKSLIQSAQHGNNAALEQLFEMNISRIFGLCFRILGVKENAETVTVLVFMEAWKQIKFIRPDISFNEWLCSMAVWNSLQYIRSGDNSKKINNKKKKPEAENKLNLSELDVAIINLPEKERLPFVLFNIEGYKEDETCDLLSIKSKELIKKLDSSGKHILKNVNVIKSSEDIPAFLNDLKREINPAINIKKLIFDQIYEQKIKEFEENKKLEPEAEPVEETEKKLKEKKKERKRKPKAPKEKTYTIRTAQFKIIPYLKKTLLIVVPLVVVIAIIYLTFLISSSNWNVKNISGNVQIDNSTVEDDGSLPLNSVITTGSNSSAVIEVPGVGSFRLGPGSKFKRTNEDKSAVFESGIIKVNMKENNDPFTLRIPGAEIKNYKPGTAYNINSLDENKFNLDVISGWAEVRSKGFQTLVPENYFIMISKINGSGLPCGHSASSDAKEIISEYTNQGNSEPVANVLIGIANQSEAISLWNLLPRLNPLNRGIIYEKLNHLIGTPESVTKDGTTNLEPRMLRLWLKYIETKLQ